MVNQFHSALNLVRITALRDWSHWEIHRESVGLWIWWCLTAEWVNKVGRQNTSSSFVPSSQIYSKLLHSFECQDHPFFNFLLVRVACKVVLGYSQKITLKMSATWKLLKPSLSLSEMWWICVKLSLCSKQWITGKWIPQKHFQGSRNNYSSSPSSTFLTETNKQPQNKQNQNSRSDV